MIIWKNYFYNRSFISIFLINKLNLKQQLTKNLYTYEKIPGPKGLPIIGNLWRYFPIIGTCKLNELHKIALKLYIEYGSLVREDLFGKHSILHVFDPNDMKIVLKYVGKYPKRRSHRALLKYRQDRFHLYNSGGLFPENGEVWFNLRKKLQKIFMNANNIRQYVKSCDQITNELFDYIINNIDENFQIKENFFEILFKWSLENTAFLALDTKLNIFNGKLNNDLKLLISSAHDTHAAISETETSLDLWKFIKTKSYRKLENAQDNMVRILTKYFNKKLETLNENFEKQNLIFYQLINNKEIDRKDTFMFLIDLFLASIDTTSFTISFVLYYLAINQDVQNKLRTEIYFYLHKTNGTFEENYLDNLSFLKACVKETMRLQPVSIGIGRISNEDFILRDYLIPKDTMIILQNQVACRLEKNFNQCEKFIPERWLKTFESNENKYEGSLDENWLKLNKSKLNKKTIFNNKNELNLKKKINPYLVLPFGFGSRVCLGRAFSEMKIYVLVAKLIFNYQISYDGDSIGTFTRLINVPDKPMLFKFKKLY